MLHLNKSQGITQEQTKTHTRAILTVLIIWTKILSMKLCCRRGLKVSVLKSFSKMKSMANSLQKTV